MLSMLRPVVGEQIWSDVFEPLYGLLEAVCHRQLASLDEAVAAATQHQIAELVEILGCEAIALAAPEALIDQLEMTPDATAELQHYCRERAEALRDERNRLHLWERLPSIIRWPGRFTVGDRKPQPSDPTTYWGLRMPGDLASPIVVPRLRAPGFASIPPWRYEPTPPIPLPLAILHPHLAPPVCRLFRPVTQPQPRRRGGRPSRHKQAVALLGRLTDHEIRSIRTLRQLHRLLRRRLGGRGLSERTLRRYVDQPFQRRKRSLDPTC